MKKRNMTAILTALMLLTACTGCGSAETMNDETMNMAPAAPAAAGAPKAAGGGDAGDNAGDVYAPAAEYDDGDADVDGYADEGDGYYDYDGYEMDAEDVAVDFAAAADKAFTAGEMAPAAIAEGDIPDIAVAEEPMPDEVPPEEVSAHQPEVGMLTAGEWHDHENWGFFSNLVNNGTIAFPSFGIDPTQRIAVTVKNAEDTALPNAKVSLHTGDGAVIWNAVTDKNGVAYVFDTGNSGASIDVVTPDGMTGSTVPGVLQSDSQGGAVLVSDRAAEVVIEAAPVLYQNTQIMFIVDTTGSMGDEMLFLQSDFSAIAEETNDGRTSYAVSFYKDEEDEYVTRTASGFTSDVGAIRSQLNAESASGGGDEPEAVAEALSDAFHLDGWADESVKIAFLIYDAPPHAGKETMLQDAIAAATEKGIHLIPVVSSNGRSGTHSFRLCRWSRSLVIMRWKSCMM